MIYNMSVAKGYFCFNLLTGNLFPGIQKLWTSLLALTPHTQSELSFSCYTVIHIQGVSKRSKLTPLTPA